MRKLLVMAGLFGLFAFEQSLAVSQEKTADFQAPDDTQFRRESILSEGTRMAAEVFAPKASEGREAPHDRHEPRLGRHRGVAPARRRSRSPGPATWSSPSTTAAGARATRG